MLAATDYPLLEVFWTILIFVGFFIWIWLLFIVFADIFRRSDIGGWGKTGWIIFVIILPYLGVFVYLIAEHKGMTERTIKQQQQAKSEMDQYVRNVAAASERPDGADRQGPGAAEQRHDQPGRVRLDQAQGARGLGAAPSRSRSRLPGSAGRAGDRLDAGGVEAEIDPFGQLPAPHAQARALADQARLRDEHFDHRAGAQVALEASEDDRGNAVRARTR